jgi:hypothetical protein
MTGHNHRELGKRYVSWSTPPTVDSTETGSQEVDRFMSGLDHPLKEVVEQLGTAILDCGRSESVGHDVRTRPARPSPLRWPSRRGNNPCCSIPEWLQPLGA